MNFDVILWNLNALEDIGDTCNLAKVESKTCGGKVTFEILGVWSNKGPCLLGFTFTCG